MFYAVYINLTKKYSAFIRIFALTFILHTISTCFWGDRTWCGNLCLLAI